MGTIAITGGSGFIGSHLVRLLCERGEHVRVLIRPHSRLDVLEGLSFEPVDGDLQNPESLKWLLEDCTLLYHVAADYRLWAANPQELYQSNVDGTDKILNAAMSAGVPRVVYTSTVGCLGIPKDGTPGNENTPVSIKDMVGHYKRSKFMAEQVALDYVQEGLPVVIVNPSTPVGPGDHKPTPTGRIIVDYLEGRIPAFVDTGLNLIDVRDAAMGHILAAEKGDAGARYILGCRNLSLAEILGMLSACSGRRAPTIRIPYPAAYSAGLISTTWANYVTHKPPGISLESVRMSRKKMYFSPEKAIRELGLPQSSIENALEEAVAWYRQYGYLKNEGSK